MEAVRVSKLTKTFSTLKAVDGLSFSVEQGAIYGFLGQNGAGKSTTIRMLLTLVQPTEGHIEIFGQELKSHRHQILQQVGALIEKPDLYNYLSAVENLKMMASLSGIKAGEKKLITELERVGLASRAKSKVRTFSQGMKQRLGIACALIHDPKLLILDEPTNGLDPQGINDVRNLILHLSHDEGKTIVVSSHLLHEIELMADSMLIIDKGKKIAEGKVKELLHPASTIVRVETDDPAATIEVLQNSQWQQHMRPSYEGVALEIHKEVIPELVSFLVQNKLKIYAVQSRHSLEDYFLSLT